MEYKRIMIDTDKLPLPKGLTLYEGLKLPMIDFERNKIKYKVTDIRPLNKAAIYAFERILQMVVLEGEKEQVEFTIEEEAPECEIELVTDILTRIGFYISGTLLVSGAERNKEKAAINYKLIKDNAVAIKKCVKEKGLPIGLWDIVETIVKREISEEKNDY